MFEATKERFGAWLHSRWMMPTLGVASFLESIIVPIPLEAILVPLMQARRERLWWLAAVALVGCILGAVVGYYVGYGLMNTAGEWVVQQLGAEDQMERAREAMSENGFWFIMSVSVVPVPFQIAMLAAGATGYPIGLYLLATLISRGVRYFGLAALVWWLGDRAESFVKEHKRLALVIVVAVVAAAWGAAYFL